MWVVAYSMSFLIDIDSCLFMVVLLYLRLQS